MSPYGIEHLNFFLACRTIHQQSIYGLWGKILINNKFFNRCFFAELLTGKPLFPGKDEAMQVQMIFDKCGDANEKDWPNVTKLKYYN